MFDFIARVRKKIKQDDYWHGDRSIGRYISRVGINGYYNDLTNKTKIGNLSSHKGIIPFVINKDGTFIHPVTVCQVGLGWYDVYLDKQNSISLKNVFICADWLLDNLLITLPEHGYWSIPYDVPLFGLKKGWASALVQGQAISLLCRAYFVSKDKKYLNACHHAFNFLILDRSKGGLRIDDSYLFEEYPSIPKSIVLNGLISTIWGIRDYFQCTKNNAVKYVYDQSICALKSVLPLYDCHNWSRYSLYPNSFLYINLASPYYHKEHISQLKALYYLEQDEFFNFYAKKWESVKDSKLHVIVVYLTKSLTIFFQKIYGIRR